MLPAIRVRFEARRLAKELREALVSRPEGWSISNDDDGGTVTSWRKYRIVLQPRAVRFFDSIHLYYDDAEIWLPIVQRLRLRAATRLLLTRFAAQGGAQMQAKSASSRRKKAARKSA
jgi:hypothetical protein